MKEDVKKYFANSLILCYHPDKVSAPEVKLLLSPNSLPWNHKRF